MKYLVMILLLVPAFAQADDRFGVIGGLTFANVRGAGDGYDWQSYFLPGFYADLGLSENAFITPQLRYMRKGASLADTITSGYADITLALKYLELPIYFKYKFPGGTSVRPNLFVGPAFGVKLGESISVTDRFTGKVTTLRHLDSGSLRKYDVALEAGGGVEFMLSADMVGSLSVAYSYGLIDLDKEATKVKTQGIQVYAGIGF
ncbi:MAG: porin family protein [Bacteriovoracia bacterium]